ncbi:N-acetyl-gamma-glutamyl-phosphate reductase [Leptospirillum ferriphilum]|uniref:N-acetyl-gamma-glutamyl-phosphate reductase n=1 Tax=Leptospirillum ferriphilum TaxID=178606 RepID=UPI000AAF4E43|nr:N-acetyl-gamma-glutamyl-phosphate reductase [Leptospirillum ferriphilum]MCL5259568.1 N-acetyl-gamma-glutamyl-phosphate reductase [Nitrospirota bacterium]
MSLLKVGIAGASGYGGGELLRLLLFHPKVQVVHVAGENRAGELVESVFPHLPLSSRMEKHPIDEPWNDIKILFTALPAGESGKLARLYRDRDVHIIDLGPDFRFRSHQRFSEVYKMPHPYPEGLSEATYSLVEWNRKAIKNSRILACPGCYPTGTLMGLLPFVQEGLLKKGSQIFIDGKSGVSGAGRGLTLDTHFPEIAESMKSYKPFSHRHGPEMEEAIECLAGFRVNILFVPHLIPVNRGLLSSLYFTLEKDWKEEDVWNVMKKYYQDETGVYLTEKPPSTAMVRGTNRTAISLRMEGSAAFVETAIDNLVKGAAGQAIQSMNVIQGWEEMEGLPMIGAFP